MGVKLFCTSLPMFDYIKHLGATLMEHKTLTNIVLTRTQYKFEVAQSFSLA